MKNAEFKFLRKNTNESVIYSKEEVRWSDETGGYKLMHGMCGSHYDVELKIAAKGFEKLERIIDLPLNGPASPQIFKIRLKQIGSNDLPGFERLAPPNTNLTGVVYDANGAVIVGAVIIAVDANKKLFQARTNNAGEYVLNLPFNKYDPSSKDFKIVTYNIVAKADSFQQSAVSNFRVVPAYSGKMKLDFALDVGASSNVVNVDN